MMGPEFKPLTEIEACIGSLSDVSDKIMHDLELIDRKDKNDIIYSNNPFDAPENTAYMRGHYLPEISVARDEYLEEARQELVGDLSKYRKLIDICVKIKNEGCISQSDHDYLFENMTNAHKKPCFKDLHIKPAMPISDLWARDSKSAVAVPCELRSPTR